MFSIVGETLALFNFVWSFVKFFERKFSRSIFLKKKKEREIKISNYNSANKKNVSNTFVNLKLS